MALQAWKSLAKMIIFKHDKYDLLVLVEIYNDRFPNSGVVCMGVVSNVILNAGSPHMKKDFAENGNVKGIYLKTFMNIEIHDSDNCNLQNSQIGKEFEVVNTAITRPKLEPGQTTEIHCSGPVNVLKSYKVTIPKERQGGMEETDSSAVQVLKDVKTERGENFMDITSQETKKDENIKKDIDSGCNPNKILKTNKEQNQSSNYWQPNVYSNYNLSNTETMGMLQRIKKERTDEEAEDMRTAVEVIEEIRKQRKEQEEEIRKQRKEQKEEIRKQRKEKEEEIRKQRKIKEQEKRNQFINLQANKTITNKQVKFKRMKKIVRTKRNAQGKILSQETVMVDLNSEEEAAFKERSEHIILKSQTSNIIDLTSEDETAFGERSEHEIVESQPSMSDMMKHQQGEGEKAVIPNKNRTVKIEPYHNNSAAASGVQFNIRTSIEDTKRAVIINNLSSSTSDNTIKELCGRAGPFQGFLRSGQSAYVVYMDFRNALKFKNKYHRYILDLSVLSVELIQESVLMHIARKGKR
ncbi:unnamed protein product [Mytilus edulis]|uniref:RRM domain-containing protein n=1 Tax=Mytilus edulis TaxID=6550 RepID=A0A8S3PPE9_MYTED|nr:unnamed protein product [Mytilus edulis]